MKKISFIIILIAAYASLQAQDTIPKPLFEDPVYHGAADPVVIYNKQKKLWWMFYTNRRASINDSTVAWVHGTRIGIAESKDGLHWKYKDTANIDYRKDSGYTFWAPDIIENKGLYHMYLTYVSGTFTDWNHPREIVHLTSKDLLNWKFESVLELASHKIIDASIIKVSDTLWRMMYNNEKGGKAIYTATSNDLYNWKDEGKLNDIGRGEGPKVFKWNDKYFMIVDIWKGMDVYNSDDLLHWKKQLKRILEEPGKGRDDQAIGGHCDVVVNNGRAFIYYFTHPGRVQGVKPNNSFETNRSVIQLTELHYVNGEIVCDRDENFSIKLKQ
jgi:beta-xylosidase